MSSWNQPQQQQNNMITGQAQFTPYWGITPQYPQTGNYMTVGNTGKLPIYKADPIHGKMLLGNFQWDQIVKFIYRMQMKI